MAAPFMKNQGDDSTSQLWVGGEAAKVG